jgi:ribonuclease HI
MANFRGGYAQNIGNETVLHAELMAMILAMEIANKKGWKYLWIESDSKSALLAFENHTIVPWTLQNRWANCLQLGLLLRWSHIFKEGNVCADILASMGHSLVAFNWWDSLLLVLRDDFLRDKLGVPSYRLV